MLKAIIIGKVDVVLIAETKLDHSFPSNKISLDGLVLPTDLIEIKMVAGSHFVLGKINHLNS